MKNATALLLVGSALLLASCDRTTVPGNVYRVSGTVVEGDLQVNPTTRVATLTTSAWQGGAGVVVGFTLDEGLISGQETARSELARGTLSADGRFTLDLPRTVDNSRLAVGFDPSADDASCTGTITVSDSNALGVAAILSVDANKDGVIEPLAVSNTVGSTGTPTGLALAVGGLLYVDRAVTLKGVQTCDGGTFTVDVDATLQAGWNKITLTLGVGASGEKVTLRSGSYPSNDWIFLNDQAAAPLGAQALSSKAVSLQRLKSRLNLPLFR